MLTHACVLACLASPAAGRSAVHRCGRRSRLLGQLGDAVCCLRLPALQTRAETLLAVDDMIESVIQVCRVDMFFARGI